jgi:histone deacetylase 11
MMLKGNGHGRDFRKQKDMVYIFDVYNKYIYPGDDYAREGISKDLGVISGTGDDYYLNLIGAELPKSLDDFNPQLIIYNAGTDCLIGDPLGGNSISK